MVDINKFNVTPGLVGKFDLTTATKEEKIEFLEAILDQYGAGNAHIVVTSKEDATKLSLASDVGGADIMA